MDSLQQEFIVISVAIFLTGLVVGIQIGLMMAHGLVCKAGVLPDRHCTPGQTDPSIGENNIHQTVCNQQYLATIKSPDLKQQLFKSYNVTGNYTIDHLIPIIDGGNIYSVKNMWPEPLHGKYNAHDKDGLEALVHRGLCDGKITLSTAEHLFSNWISVWKRNHMPRTNQTVE